MQQPLNKAPRSSFWWPSLRGGDSSVPASCPRTPSPSRQASPPLPASPQARTARLTAAASSTRTGEERADGRVRRAAECAAMAQPGACCRPGIPAVETKIHPASGSTGLLSPPCRIAASNNASLRRKAGRWPVEASGDTLRWARRQ